MVISVHPESKNVNSYFEIFIHEFFIVVFREECYTMYRICLRRCQDMFFLLAGGLVIIIIAVIVAVVASVTSAVAADSDESAED